MVYNSTILHNYFSLSDLEFINSCVVEHLKNPLMTNHQKWSTYYSVSKEAFDFLNIKLPKLENEILAVHYYISHGIAGPHSDKGWRKGGRTFIIPLENAISYTVVFDQIQEQEIYNDEFFKKLPILNATIKNEHKQIDLSHLLEMNKLSIETSFFWNAGDVLIFDRRKLHCSDNFVKNNNGAKKAIVIWSDIE